MAGWRWSSAVQGFVRRGPDWWTDFKRIDGRRFADAKNNLGFASRNNFAWHWNFTPNWLQFEPFAAEIHASKYYIQLSKTLFGHMLKAANISIAYSKIFPRVLWVGPQKNSLDYVLLPSSLWSELLWQGIKWLWIKNFKNCCCRKIALLHAHKRSACGLNIAFANGSAVSILRNLRPI